MKRQIAGVLYAEALVAVVILAMALVPATNALQAALRSSERFTNTTVADFGARSRMEELAAEPFAALDAAALAAGGRTVATSYSDAGGPGRRLVFLARYDADNADADNDPFTGVEADLLWIRVEIEGTKRGFETLLSP